MKKTKIICSIGPVSNNREIMEEMVLKGMDCARINMSHSNYEEIDSIIDVVREVRKSTNVPIAIMYDTKGPELRTLAFEKDIEVKTNQMIKIVKDNVLGNLEKFSLNHEEVLNKLNIGNKVLIDDALIEFEVIEKEENEVLLKALNDGVLKSHKSVTIPGIDLGLEFISEEDKKDIEYAATHSCDYLALSFVNRKEDVEEARKIIESAGGDARIIAKIESRLGVENIDEIMKAADGIMIARGDLGVEVSMEELPFLQKQIITKCRENGKFAIVATEMLASMYENPRPTRAEVSDIANAVIDGTDCVMLSGETTIGKYPIHAVEIMANTCIEAEKEIDYTKHTAYKRTIGISDTIARLAVDAVEYDNIKLIVAPTMTGFSARKISNLRPNCSIMACCPSSHIAEKVALNFGVKSVITEVFDNTDQMVEHLKELSKKEFNLEEGDLILITGGFPPGRTRRTNYLRIVEI